MEAFRPWIQRQKALSEEQDVLEQNGQGISRCQVSGIIKTVKLKDVQFKHIVDWNQDVKMTGKRGGGGELSLIFAPEIHMVKKCTK